jgi:hypothetical protein
MPWKAKPEAGNGKARNLRRYRHSEHDLRFVPRVVCVVVPELFGLVNAYFVRGDRMANSIVLWNVNWPFSVPNPSREGQLIEAFMFHLHNEFL